MPRRGAERAWAAAATICLCLTAAGGDAAEAAPTDWNLEVGGGVLLFSPNIEKIPRGRSATAVSPLHEVALGRRLSSRLELHLAAARASGSSSEWESESGQGVAVIPTPSVTTVLALLEAPLLRGEGRVVPQAGVGVGLAVFDEVDESIRFDWGTHVTLNRIRFDAHTDAAVLFELGVRVRLDERVVLVSRYHLLSTFRREQVNTADRATLSARFGF